MLPGIQSTAPMHPAVSTFPTVSCTKSVIAVACVIFSALLVLSSLILALVINLAIPLAVASVVLAISTLVLIRLGFKIKTLCSSKAVKPGLENKIPKFIPLTKLTGKDYESVMSWLKKNELVNDPNFITKYKIKQTDLLEPVEQLALYMWSTPKLFGRMNWVSSGAICDSSVQKINEIAIEALKKLPPFPHQEKLYRGATFTEKQLLLNYPQGQVIILDRFMSTTMKEKVHDNPKISSHPSGNVHVIFSVSGKSGKSIIDYSQYPEEAEILFSPGTKFLVQEVIIDGRHADVSLKEE